MSGVERHVSIEYERAVLDALLSGVPAIAPRVFVDGGLRPEHFWRLSHAAVCRAAMDLHDASVTADATTVRHRLAETGTLDAAGGQAGLDAILGSGWSAGALGHYCATLRELAAWRARHTAAFELLSAVAEQQPAGVDRALSALAAADAGRNAEGAYDPAQATDAVMRHVSEGTMRAKWRWPLPRLNRLTHGGLRPGQVTLISGPTRHGKSVFTDAVLEQCARDGAKARLYLNEMDRDERSLRTAARGAGVMHGKLVNGELSPRDHERIVQWGARGGVTFGLQECDGWSAQDVARDARHRRLDVIAFDLLDELPLLAGMTRRETAEESMRVLKQLALGAGCHVLAVTHLNRNRSSQSATIPMPALGDIRESGMLANRASNVVFVWREQDRDTGDPLDDGVIRVAKARQGTPGGVEVFFDGDRQRFLEREDSGRVAVAA